VCGKYGSTGSVYEGISAVRKGSFTRRVVKWIQFRGGIVLRREDVQKVKEHVNIVVNPEILQFTVWRCIPVR
jgi:hypothetical protein